jgi:hypothetical protein
VDTGLCAAACSCLNCAAEQRRKLKVNQVRKIAIMAMTKTTAAVPYFTSMMKPS